MNSHTLGLAVIAVAGQLFAGRSPAQEKVAPAKPVPSIQQQIDELKEGQERVIRELGEIKKLLEEKPNRIDSPTKPTLPNVVAINVHGEPFRGSIAARVAIMEYSDFECSFCAKYVRDVFPQIDREYVQTGRIKYFFRDLPGPGETNAVLKARAARCAGEQGKFWDLHDRFFATQSDPSGRDMAIHAQELALDAEKFNACLDSERYADSIRLSVAGARKIGIYGTPAFLIGTISEDGDFLKSAKILVGGDSVETIRSALDELLAPESKK